MSSTACVTATVNYATEKAAVSFEAGSVAPADLVKAVQAAGYERDASRAARR